MKKISIVIFLISICALYFIPNNYSITVSNDYIFSDKIIIDAGHGSFDGGAQSDDGVLEKDINLKIANKLETFCKFAGFEVVMTRKDDSALNDDKSLSISQRKKSDMLSRLEIIQENEDAIFVSIHLNKFTSSAAKGGQVFYSKNNDKSKMLADSIQTSIKLLQKQNNRSTKKADSSIFLLNKSQIPAVIVECGFLSNQSDLDLLKTDKYQSQLAYTILCGILEYKKQE